MVTRMARPWREIRRGKGVPTRDARVGEHRRAMEDAIALADLRESQSTTQVELAQRLGVNQGNVSRLERRDDLYLSTLRDYVAALGGELELVVRFPDGDEVRIEPRRDSVPVG